MVPLFLRPSDKDIPAMQSKTQFLNEKKEPKEEKFDLKEQKADIEL